MATPVVTDQFNHMNHIQQLKINGRSVLKRPAPAPREGSLVLLHGYGADEYDLMGLAPFFSEKLDILSIRAPGATPFGGASWFDIDMNAQGDLRFNADQALASGRGVIELIAELTKSEDIPAGKLILGGFSQGASISMLVALMQPLLIKALLVMSGRLTQGADALIKQKDLLKQLPVFAGHGIQDQVIPISYGREIVAFWETLPVELTHHEYAMGHEINQAELADIQAWMDPLV